MSKPLTKHQDDIRRGLRPKPKRDPFKPIAVTCGSCGRLIAAQRPREYVTCGCPASTMVDAGDGYYWRCGGEVDQVWSFKRKKLNGKMVLGWWPSKWNKRLSSKFEKQPDYLTRLSKSKES